LDANILMKKSAEELCSLTPLHEAAHRAAGRGRARMAGPAQAKAKQVAHGGPSATPDGHGVQ
jgi:hypothetical protein